VCPRSAQAAGNPAGTRASIGLPAPSGSTGCRECPPGAATSNPRFVVSNHRTCTGFSRLGGPLGPSGEIPAALPWPAPDPPAWGAGNQYSPGRRMQVEERSASVITQSRAPWAVR
jgi:hypothetical protein